MKNWSVKALTLLEETLTPPEHELNELDWKAALSPDKRRLTEHLGAFSNHPGGGWLVCGVSSNATPLGVDSDDVDRIVNQLANLGREALEPPLTIDHAVLKYGNVPLLFAHIAES